MSPIRFDIWKNTWHGEGCKLEMTTNLLASISTYHTHHCIVIEIPVRMHINSKQFGAKLSKLHVYQVLITFASIFLPPEVNKGHECQFQMMALVKILDWLLEVGILMQK